MALFNCNNKELYVINTAPFAFNYVNSTSLMTRRFAVCFVKPLSLQVAISNIIQLLVKSKYLIFNTYKAL